MKDGVFSVLDDLVLHLKGLVLVRELRRRRGAEDDELLMYASEIARVREQLADLVKSVPVPAPSPRS
jgi:hypothetical protein